MSDERDIDAGAQPGETDAEREARIERAERTARRKYEPAFKGVVIRDADGPRVTWQQRQAEQAAADAERAEERSHWRARLERQTRNRTRDALAMVLLLVVGVGTLMVILSQQNTSLPGWIPIYGQDVIELEGEIASAHGVTPGQGQAVMMNGVQIGLISNVRLEDGVAVVGMDVQRKYAPIIREDASLLLRPRTNLNDMTIQIDPGSQDAPPIEDDTRITLENSAPNIQPEQFFAALDADTRSYLKLLLQGGARALDEGRGKKLSAAFRRFEPFSRFIAQFNGALAKRREEMANVIHNFSRLTVELGRNGDDIRNFVESSSGALEGFANRQEEIRGALREFPSTLETTQMALDNANRYALEARTTLAELVPQAEALGPGLEDTRKFFEQTTAPLEEQIRPFSRQLLPLLRDAARGSEPLNETVTNFGNALNSLNYGFNALAHNPGASKPGYLFYLPWLNHNLNANYVEDGLGGQRRAILLITCRAADLADGFVEERPSLKTVQQATNAPRGLAEICPPGS